MGPPKGANQPHNFFVSSQIVRPPMLCTSSIMWHTALSTPEAEKVEPLRAEARSRLQHPAVVAFVRILVSWRWTQFDRQDMERSARLHRKKAVAPTVAGKVNRLLKKGRLVEGDVELKPS